MRGFTAFEFDLPGALLERLIAVLDSMDDVPLTTAHAQQIPDAQGVYQLFLDGQLVYIGKTDAEAGLRKRLIRHANKILNRPNIEQRIITCKAVQIFVFTAMDLETALIKHYQQQGQRTEWNGSGFGSNDPGRNRETTNRKPEGFDARFPISVDVADEYLPVGTHDVGTALATLKHKLNYTLRYETKIVNGRPQPSQPHPDLIETSFQVTTTPQTIRELLAIMLVNLPDGWQATIFASHVILYKEYYLYTYGEPLRK